MVKVTFYSIFITMLITACSESSFEKSFIRNPVNIVIQKNAARDDFVKTDETEAMCNDFILTEVDVKEFFMVALEETEQEYSQGQVKSRCYAEGELTLPRKFKGKWRIDKTRRGILMVENKQAYFFYCDSCGSRKYAERR